MSNPCEFEGKNFLGRGNDNHKGPEVQYRTLGGEGEEVGRGMGGATGSCKDIDF